ncbi:ARI5B-like protein, partial [Mya arenaria]
RTKRSHLIEKKQRKKPGKENLPVNPPGAGETASIGGFESPEQFSQSKLRFLNTMTDKTKEEKFTMDIDMYKKNEKAFEHDVYRFMSRHGRQIRSVLVWHNIPVRMFQVYLAVHERGGFNMVSKKKQWTAVFKELTEQQNSPNGVPVKKYYERNLYPYELYMGGKDYMACFTAQDSSNLKPAKKTKKNNSAGTHGQTQGGDHATGIIGEKRGDNSGG